MFLGVFIFLLSFFTRCSLFLSFRLFHIQSFHYFSLLSSLSFLLTFRPSSLIINIVNKFLFFIFSLFFSFFFLSVIFLLVHFCMAWFTLNPHILIYIYIYIYIVYSYVAYSLLGKHRRESIPLLREQSVKVSCKPFLFKRWNKSKMVQSQNSITSIKISDWSTRLVCDHSPMIIGLIKLRNIIHCEK